MLSPRRYAHDTRACRRRKRTHRAIERFSTFGGRHRYGAECDICRYFPSVDHAILLAILQRRMRLPDSMQLVRQGVTRFRRRVHGPVAWPEATNLDTAFLLVRLK